MIALLVIAAALIVIQAAVLIANLVYWRRSGSPAPRDGPRLSVLIPARNERDNLPILLAALSAQQSPAWEVLVCDDASDDGTTDWLTDHAAQFGALWFRAPDKPGDWVGKCWACHQLGMRASGDWLLFLDADVTPAPGFLGEMSAAMAGADALLVTALPRSVPATPGDGTLTAMVPFSVFTLLPLVRAEKDTRQAFAFANGQVIGFRCEDYRRHRPHEQVRQMLLEDVGLARWAKRMGRGVLIVDATGTLKVRMYRGLAQAVWGLARTAVPICGSIPGAMLVALLLAVAYLSPWVTAVAGDRLAQALVALGALLYGVCTARFGIGGWYALLTPLAMAVTVATILRSILWHRRGGVPWKGRLYSGLESGGKQRESSSGGEKERGNPLEQDPEAGPPHSSA